MKKIVIVEDEEFMREELEAVYKREGYAVSLIVDFHDVAADILGREPDLIVVDLNLPGTTGFDICRQVKRQMSVPILILTSRDQMRDELHALQLGADDFLTKPCHKERLLARTENLLRRFEGRKHMLDGGGFLLDRQTYTVYKDEQAVILPDNQGKILELLLGQFGGTVTKETLSYTLWGTAEFIDENALQVNITRLKKTLKSLELETRLETVRGIGYRFLRKEGEFVHKKVL